MTANIEVPVFGSFELEENLKVFIMGLEKSKGTLKTFFRYSTFKRN